MATATGDIRNLALLGHAGAGKTLLAEALLFGAGAIRAKGSLARGTTVPDHDPQARRLQHSVDASLCWLETGRARVTLVDTPGYPDFIGRTLPVLEAVEKGRSMTRRDLKVPPRHDDDAALDAAVALLAAWTGQVAAEAGIEPRLLATRDDVRALVNGRPTPLDHGWRAEMVGDRIRELVAGKGVLRLVDGGRRVRLESGS